MDDNTKSVNSYKTHHEIKCGKIKRSKDFRAEMLQELKNEMKDEKETDALVVGDFNEDVNAKNIQEFMVEMRLHEVLSEFH